MEVDRHEPASWYLLKKENKHYIDVNCSQSFVSFSILMQLDDEEESELHALGDTFLHYLAAKVNYWSSRYWPRNINGALADEANDAVMRWQQLHQAEA